MRSSTPLPAEEERPIPRRPGRTLPGGVLLDHAKRATFLSLPHVHVKRFRRRLQNLPAGIPPESPFELPDTVLDHVLIDQPRHPGIGQEPGDLAVLRLVVWDQVAGNVLIGGLPEGQDQVLLRELPQDPVDGVDQG